MVCLAGSAPAGQTRVCSLVYHIAPWQVTLSLLMYVTQPLDTLEFATSSPAGFFLEFDINVRIKIDNLKKMFSFVNDWCIVIR